MKVDFNKRRNRGTGLPVATAGKYAKDRMKWRNNVNTKWAKPLSGVCNYVK